MSQAYKCDGCDEYRDGEPSATLIVHGVGTSQQHGASGETLREQELCEECRETVEQTLS